MPGSGQARFKPQQALCNVYFPGRMGAQPSSTLRVKAASDTCPICHLSWVCWGCSSATTSPAQPGSRCRYKHTIVPQQNWPQTRTPSHVQVLPPSPPSPCSASRCITGKPARWLQPLGAEPFNQPHSLPCAALSSALTPFLEMQGYRLYLCFQIWVFCPLKWKQWWEAEALSWTLLPNVW